MQLDTNTFYEHQKKYYDKLEGMQTDRFHSIICIPTGGGKTRLAVVYTINNEINNGKKILWLTHSKYLLNQAYYTFESYLGKQWMQDNAIIIHSDTPYRCDDISESQKIVFVSFQSLIRCKIDWKNKIGENVTIIIDETHHIVAESYMNIVSDYSSDKKVLGLTATPIRANRGESNELYKYYETDLGIKVHIATLFKSKILVRPIFEDVEFTIDTDEIHTVDELTNGLLGEIQNYNQLIFEQYKNNEKKYGKTVIFAINKEHVDLLYNLFQLDEKYQNRVYRVYSGLSEREEEFKAFTESKDGILINVNIMNEGVDIPSIQTVFMTKPLNSRITVTQIIGRALRKAEGKTHAIIVNFAVSNLGRKFLIVTPKLSYKLYEAEWNEDDDEIDEIELEEENIDSIAKLVKEHIEKKAVCSFSNVCLAGHYTILDGDDSDIPVPVSFIEYRKIEQYISAKKNQIEKTFPKKLFFCDEVESVKEYIDKSITSDVKLMFTKYDEDIFTKYDEVYSYVKLLYEKIVRDNLSEKRIREEISSFYNSMNEKGYSDLLSYLSQIGANTENQFVNLIRNELVNVKFEK